ncbi:hypothetical protein NW768_005581 [Fusarium equiseti]|uniref:Integral membrane protein n=1 Tax=Fusarium equiseti TaxID=61235 RepID=A0ABQ8RCB4_FUSEQ|nr:hypothetical protein NW768_005581 [Fusarium equiseti]
MTDPEPCHPIISSKQLALARRAYSIQSEIFHIPDGWGFFTAGPPPQQVYELRGVFRLLIMSCFAYAVLAFILYNALRFGDGLNYFFKAFLRINLTLCVLLVADLWGAHRLDPDYDWKTWEIDDDGSYMHADAWATIPTLPMVLLANIYFPIPKVMMDRWFPWRSAWLQSWGLEV